MRFIHRFLLSGVVLFGFVVSSNSSFAGDKKINDACEVTATAPQHQFDIHVLLSKERWAHIVCPFSRDTDSAIRLYVFRDGPNCNTTRTLPLNIVKLNVLPENVALKMALQCTAMAYHASSTIPGPIYTWHFPVWLSTTDRLKLYKKVTDAIDFSGIPIKIFTNQNTQYCFELLDDSEGSPREMMAKLGIEIPKYVTEYRRASDDCTKMFLKSN